MMGTTQPHPEYKVLVEKYADAPFGTVIPHSEIAAVTQFAYGSRRYYMTVNRWKRAMLWDHDRVVNHVHKIGYQITEPERCVTEARGDVKRSNRMLLRGAKKAQATPVHLLSEEQAMAHANFSARIGPALAMMQRTVKATRPTALLNAERLKIGDGK